MGVIYERTSAGNVLRLRPSAERRTGLLDRFYWPHHAQLAQSVQAAVSTHGRCLIIDGHSFSSAPLSHEADQEPDRPDICIGTDPFHTPPGLVATAAREARRLGWSVLVDRPFSGALVPLSHYRRDERVVSLMLELNRRTYMDETTGLRLSHFADVRRRLHALIRSLVATPS